MKTAGAVPSSASEGDAFAIGIDVGGTKIAGGLVNLSRGTLMHRHEQPTHHERGGEAVLADVEAMMRSLMNEASQGSLRVTAAGIGVPELVDPQGNVFSDYRVAWKGLPVQTALSRIVATRLEADVRAAARGEALFGAGRPYRDFLYVNIGTGISSTWVRDGQPYPGARGAALVLASGRTPCQCPACGVDSSYVLEDIASGHGIVTEFSTRKGVAVKRAQDVLDAAQSGDVDARQVVERATHALAAAIGQLVNVLDPEAVIVGGGLGNAPGLYWSQLRKAIPHFIWSQDVRNALPVIQAGLGPDTGIIGAAAASLGRFGVAAAGTPNTKTLQTGIDGREETCAAH